MNYRGSALDDLQMNIYDLTFFDMADDSTALKTGDMPGDKVLVSQSHVNKARTTFPKLLDELRGVYAAKTINRAVVSVCGGSGVGKSEVASLLALFLNRLGLGTYIISGDNYPHRIPKYNDAERLMIYRSYGIDGLIATGLYNKDVARALQSLMADDADADTNITVEHHWLSVYRRYARDGLAGYLGSPSEIDFGRLNGIISQYQNGADMIPLKRMGREDHELWYEHIDFSKVNVLILEWTHSNSRYLTGVDIPIFLYSTPEETLAHRRARARDGGVDKPFTSTVLEIEGKQLLDRAAYAKIILSKTGELVTYESLRCCV
jgi:hypothetical protein